jgi:hypothetical protein
VQRTHRKITAIIYRLKRQWGLHLVYYRPTTAEYNVETGEVSRGFDTYVVKRAIVLPARLDRSFVYDLTFIQANNNFVGGGYFDRNQRRLIIDAKDLPKDFDPAIKDHVEFDGKRYEVLYIDHVEKRKAYLFRVAEVTSSETVGP